MSLETEIKKTIFKHIMLTKNLQDYIMLDIKTPENLEHIKASNDCAFEDLFRSEESKAYRGKTFFLTIKSMHTQIHEDINRLTKCIERNDMKLAKSIMIGGIYHQNVEVFINALTQWIGEVRTEELKKKKKLN
jgi:hypothetical protein